MLQIKHIKPKEYLMQEGNIRTILNLDKIKLITQETMLTYSKNGKSTCPPGTKTTLNLERKKKKS